MSISEDVSFRIRLKNIMMENDIPTDGNIGVVASVYSVIKIVCIHPAQATISLTFANHIANHGRYTVSMGPVTTVSWNKMMRAISGITPAVVYDVVFSFTKQTISVELWDMTSGHANDPPARFSRRMTKGLQNWKIDNGLNREYDLVMRRIAMCVDNMEDIMPVLQVKIALGKRTDRYESYVESFSPMETVSESFIDFVKRMYPNVITDVVCRVEDPNDADRHRNILSLHLRFNCQGSSTVRRTVDSDDDDGDRGGGATGVDAGTAVVKTEMDEQRGSLVKRRRLLDPRHL